MAIVTPEDAIRMWADLTNIVNQRFKETPDTERSVTILRMWNYCQLVLNSAIGPITVSGDVVIAHGPTANPLKIDVPTNLATYIHLPELKTSVQFAFLYEIFMDGVVARQVPETEIRATVVEEMATIYKTAANEDVMHVSVFQAISDLRNLVKATRLSVIDKIIFEGVVNKLRMTGILQYPEYHKLADVLAYFEGLLVTLEIVRYNEI